MKLETKDLLTGDEISSKEFLKLIDFSIKLKKQNKTGKEKPQKFSCKHDCFYCPREVDENGIEDFKY